MRDINQRGIAKLIDGHSFQEIASVREFLRRLNCLALKAERFITVNKGDQGIWLVGSGHICIEK